MKNRLIVFALTASFVWGQTPQPGIVYGKVVVEGPNISTALYGKGAKKVEQGVVYACAANGTVTVQPSDFYIHISGAAPMSSADAVAIITSSYGSQTPQKVARDLGVATASIGIAVASGGLLSGISARALGWMLGGTGILNQEIIPAITANAPSLSTLLGGVLDQMGPQTLNPNGPCLNAKFFMATPPKGTVYPLEATYSFIPGTVPVGTPVTLRHISLNEPIKIKDATQREAEKLDAILAKPDPTPATIKPDPRESSWFKTLHPANESDPVLMADLPGRSFSTLPVVGISSISDVRQVTTGSATMHGCDVTVADGRINFSCPVQN